MHLNPAIVRSVCFLPLWLCPFARHSPPPGWRWRSPRGWPLRTPPAAWLPASSSSLAGCSASACSGISPTRRPPRSPKSPLRLLLSSVLPWHDFSTPKNEPNWPGEWCDLVAMLTNKLLSRPRYRRVVKVERKRGRQWTSRGSAASQSVSLRRFRRRWFHPTLKLDRSGRRHPNDPRVNSPERYHLHCHSTETTRVDTRKYHRFRMLLFSKSQCQRDLHHDKYSQIKCCRNEFLLRYYRTN